MVVFEKYGGQKNFLQSQLQVAPQERGASLDGVQLTLAGKTNQVNLPLDPLGRTRLPAAQGRLRRERRADAEPQDRRLQRCVRACRSRCRPMASTRTAELRAACEQALGFARYGDGSLRTRQCGGVRFVFAKRAAEIGVRVHRPDGSDASLAVSAGAAFPGDADDGFPTVLYRFTGSEKVQLVTAYPPLAIVPVFE